MKRPKIADLHFEKVPLAEGQYFFCNYCAEKGMTGGWHRAKIQVDAKTSFSIMICSDLCLNKFLADDRSQELVNDGFRRTKEKAFHAKKGLI